MSYTEDWRDAWTKRATNVINVNLINGRGIGRLNKEYQTLDLIVILHSATSDSNIWLAKLLKNLKTRPSCKIVIFVGNEFSSPWLSTETRIENLKNMSPDLIVTQLEIGTGKWLYEKTGAQVISVPPGIPNYEYSSVIKKSIDLSYRGFIYPWYLLDDDRNSTINSIIKEATELRWHTDFSQSSRLGRNDWMALLSNSKLTMSSEAGSKFVFRTDEVWDELLEYMKIRKYKFTNISNDASGMTLLRLFPTPIKKLIRKSLSRVGVSQGSLYVPSSEEEERLLNLIKPNNFEFKVGKCISSRHLDAIACRTWQILAPGKYNGILQEGKHFSWWDSSNPSGSLASAMNNQFEGRAEIAYQELIKDNSYDARVTGILAALE
jgi:hypothetical protein